LSASLDLLPQFGGVRLQSLIRAADEELLGSWASITSDLISFFRSKNMSVYSEIADALDSMADSSEHHDVNPLHPAVSVTFNVSIRADAYLKTAPQVKFDIATSLIKGERFVAIPGRFYSREAYARPDSIVLPDLRAPADYASAPCKHECAILN
jgi:hypothetical protein